VAAVVLLGCVGIMIGATAWWSPLVTEYREWQDGGEIVRAYVQGARGCFEQVPAGGHVILDEVPTGINYHSRESSITGVTLLDDYSVQAIANLFAPDKGLEPAMKNGKLVTEPPKSLASECSNASDGWHFKLVGF
jgi:hypothetical protein